MNAGVRIVTLFSGPREPSIDLLDEHVVAMAHLAATATVAAARLAGWSRDDALVWKRTRPTAFFLFSFWHTLSLSMVVVVRGKAGRIK